MEKDKEHAAECKRDTICRSTLRNFDVEHVCLVKLHGNETIEQILCMIKDDIAKALTHGNASGGPNLDDIEAVFDATGVSCWGKLRCCENHNNSRIHRFLPTVHEYDQNIFGAIRQCCRGGSCYGVRIEALHGGLTAGKFYLNSSAVTGGVLPQQSTSSMPGCSYDDSLRIAIKCVDLRADYGISSKKGTDYCRNGNESTHSSVVGKSSAVRGGVATYGFQVLQDSQVGSFPNRAVDQGNGQQLVMASNHLDVRLHSQAFMDSFRRQEGFPRMSRNCNDDL